MFKVVERLVDLLSIVGEPYYHASMKGSFSIKAVLPTLAPELAHANLGEVRDGMAAGATCQEILNTETDQERRQILT